VEALGTTVHEAVRSGRPFRFSARQVFLRPRPWPTNRTLFK
jgi:hypothetical protein